MLLEILKKKLRRLKKKGIVHKAEAARGGTSCRILARLDRQNRIRVEKKKVKDDLIYSWRLGEIKPPNHEEYKRIFSDEVLTWNFLLELQKKYWRENI
jgi:hypothetical protein